MSSFETVAAELTLSLENSAVGSIANNLTTTVEGYALDARQGYVLDQKKLDLDKVANNLVTTQEGWALDARQGKYLNDIKVNYTEFAEKAAAEIAKSRSTATVTLYASNWSGSGPYTQSASVSGVTASNIVIVTPGSTNYESYTDALVRCSAQGVGTLTFTAEEKPSVNLSANVLIML